MLFPGKTYQQNLKKFNEPTLQSRRNELREKLFKQIMCDPLYKLYDLLPTTKPTKIQS